MTLLQMSTSAAVLIAVITVLRAVSIHKLPKKPLCFYGESLYSACLFRFPFRPFSVFTHGYRKIILLMCRIAQITLIYKDFLTFPIRSAKILQ